MSIDPLDATADESWPFWSIAFFVFVGVLEFPAADYAGHAFVQGIGVGFTVPMAVMTAVGATMPFALPAAVLAAVLGLYAWYRETFGESAFLVLCGCFVAVLAAA